jgi:virginiamycin B lyase
MPRLLACLIALIALAVAPAAASAAPAVSGEFDVAPETPGRSTQGPDGNVWVVLSGTNDVAKVAPSGDVQKFDVAALGGATDITVGPDRNLWVTTTAGVARFSPADPGAATPFTEANLASAQGITTGPDNNLWVAKDDKVYKVPPGDPTNETPFPVTGMSARGIASSGGLLWVADFGGKRVISVTTVGVTTPYDVAGGGPQEVTGGPGTQIAYTNPNNELGRISQGGAAQEKITGAVDPFGIVLGTDGAYWSAQFASHDIGRLTTDGQYSTLGGLSATSGPRHITTGANNTLWVSLETAKKVARITGVDPPPNPLPPPDTTSPLVTSVSLTNTVFRRGLLLAKLTGLRRAIPTGTTIRWRVNEQSRSTLRFSRLVTGRRVGRRCLANTRARRSRPRCTRKLSPRRLTYTTAPGPRRLRFQGRLSRTRRLSPGRYELAIQAVDAAGNRSRTVRKRFRLLAALRRR